MTDGNLPAALRDFDDALHTIAEPQHRYSHGLRATIPSLYIQLADSICGQQGTYNSAIPRSIPPLWCDAVDLLNEIDTAVKAWQPEHGYRMIRPLPAPATIMRLIILRARPWRPQDVHSINQITNNLENWSDRITNLLDPEHIKYVSAPCPACNKTTVYRNDSTGERVRQPALQIITNQGCTCQACSACWGPQLYMHLCRLLGFALPAGVLE